MTTEGEPQLDPFERQSMLYPDLARTIEGEEHLFLQEKLQELGKHHPTHLVIHLG